MFLSTSVEISNRRCWSGTVTPKESASERLTYESEPSARVGSRPTTYSDWLLEVLECRVARANLRILPNPEPSHIVSTERLRRRLNDGEGDSTVIAFVDNPLAQPLVLAYFKYAFSLDPTVL